MFKVTCVAEDQDSVTLKVEGRIVGPWVGELQKECDQCLAKRGKLILDITGVTFVDDEGIKVLKSKLGDTVQLTGPSLFISELLKGESQAM